MKKVQQESESNFKAADANNDGVLDRVEFLVYCQLEKEASDAKGFPLAHASMTEE